MDDTAHTALGLSEQELREALAEELTLAIHAEQNSATIHAIAHSVARVISLDHMRMAEELERAGIGLRTGAADPSPSRAS